MADNEKLLKLKPKGALVNMINDANRTLFDGGVGSELEITNPVERGTVATDVTVSARKQRAKPDSVPEPGSTTFRFNRLDVAANLGGFLNGWRPELPTSTQEVLNELTHRTGYTFEKEDFIQEDILRTNATPYVLKANPNSLRWTGSLSVTLLDLVDLESYLLDALPVETQSLSFTMGMVPNQYHHPYLNGTSTHKLLSGTALGAVADSATHPVAQFLQASVPTLGGYLMAEDFQSYKTTWDFSGVNVSATNAYQAKYLGRGRMSVALNPNIPDMLDVINIELSRVGGSRSSALIQVPYRDTTFDDSEYNDTPRLRCSGVTVDTDGTAWNEWLNAITAPTVFPDIPSYLDFRPTGSVRWVNDELTPGPTNLHQAVVQYNGERRSIDPEPYNPECNRVLQVTLGQSNTALSGNFNIYYRAPIILALPSTVPANADLNIDLAPTEGVAPYVCRLVAGTFPEGVEMSTAGILTGKTVALGRHRPVVEVSDARNVTVRYTVVLDVVSVPVTLKVQPPVATLDQPWEFVFEISGGVPSFTYTLIDPPAGFTVTRLTRTISGTFTGNPGVRYLTMDVTDSALYTTRLLIPVSVL